MTDIIKCGNDCCPLRHTCWRFLAPVADTGCQSWAVYNPVAVSLMPGNRDGWDCLGYWAHPPKPKEKNDGK